MRQPQPRQGKGQVFSAPHCVWDSRTTRGCDEIEPNSKIDGVVAVCRFSARREHRGAAGAAAIFFIFKRWLHGE